MSLTPLQPLDPSSPTFRSDVDTFFRSSMPNFVGEANLLAANLNSIAAGGAYAIPYTFSTVGAAAGPGLISLDYVGSQNAANRIYLRWTDARGAAVYPIVSRFDDSTSSIKGGVRIQKVGDPSKWMSADITAAMTEYSDYAGINITITGSSDANPLANGDAVIVFFQRTGDKGDTGPAGPTILPMLHVREQYASGNGGASLSAGSSTCALNTAVTNTVSGASLSGGQITLPAGTYDFEGGAVMVLSGGFKSALFNVTDGVALGTGMAITVGPNNYNDGPVSPIRGRITLAAQKTLELRRVANTGGLAGSQVSSGGYSEIYSEIIFRKAA